MICERCKSQYNSELSSSETGKFIGLCKKCGTRLKYDDFPEGFFLGSTAMLFSTPLTFIFFFNGVLLLVALTGILVANLIIWYSTKKIGGTEYFATQEAYKKTNWPINITGVLTGAFLSFLWLAGVVRFLN